MGQILLATIVRATETQAGLRPGDLVARLYGKPITTARDRAVLLARRIRPELSSPDVGSRLGGRHHTTILECQRRATARLERGDAEEVAALGEVLSQLGLERLPPPHPHAATLSRLARDLRSLEARAESLRAKIAGLTGSDPEEARHDLSEPL